jgi:hypothetical protein
MATKAIPPLRVWWLALAILAILIVLGAILLVVLDDPFKFLAVHRDFGTACGAGITVSGLPPLWA